MDKKLHRNVQTKRLPCLLKLLNRQRAKEGKKKAHLKDFLQGRVRSLYILTFRITSLFILLLEQHFGYNHGCFDDLACLLRGKGLKTLFK